MIIFIVAIIVATVVALGTIAGADLVGVTPNGAVAGAVGAVAGALWIVEERLMTRLRIEFLMLWLAGVATTLGAQEIDTVRVGSSALEGAQLEPGVVVIESFTRVDGVDTPTSITLSSTSTSLASLGSVGDESRRRGLVMQLKRRHRRPAIMAVTLVVAGCSFGKRPSLDTTLRTYIEAANRHDIDAIAAMMTEDVVWYLGPDTLIGRSATLAPTAFDQGANTTLMVDNVVAHGDTVDFNLVEHNDVLDALGIAELHHFPRFVFRDGLISMIQARRPPLELSAFSDSVASFMQWIGQHDPDGMGRLWPEGRFAYSAETGAEMPALVLEWRRRENTTAQD